jgi:hypothetical protein
MIDAGIKGKGWSRDMTTAQAIEYRITRQALQRRSKKAPRAGFDTWADRLIAVLAVTAGLFVLGSYLQELLWVSLAAGAIVTMGIK